MKEIMRICTVARKSVKCLLQKIVIFLSLCSEFHPWYSCYFCKDFQIEKTSGKTLAFRENWVYTLGQVMKTTATQARHKLKSTETCSFAEKTLGRCDKVPLHQKI